MKLQVGHSEIVAGLVAFLDSKGVKGFDPATVAVEFSFKRGTKELECTLDDSPVAAAPVVKAEPKPKAETATATAGTGNAQASEAKPAAEAPAEQAASTEAAATATAASPVDAKGDDENLFD